MSLHLLPLGGPSLSLSCCCNPRREVAETIESSVRPFSTASPDVPAEGQTKIIEVGCHTREYMQPLHGCCDLHMNMAIRPH